MNKQKQVKELIQLKDYNKIQEMIGSILEREALLAGEYDRARVTLEYIKEELLKEMEPPMQMLNYLTRYINCLARRDFFLLVKMLSNEE